MEGRGSKIQVPVGAEGWRGKGKVSWVDRDGRPRGFKGEGTGVKVKGGKRRKAEQKPWGGESCRIQSGELPRVPKRPVSFQTILSKLMPTRKEARIAESQQEFEKRGFSWLRSSLEGSRIHQREQRDLTVRKSFLGQGSQAIMPTQNREPGRPSSPRWGLSKGLSPRLRE